MTLSQKCQYAVRAILELAKHYNQGAMSAAKIAEYQAIPRRFLEIILNELKPSGLIDSVRGAHGGYFLVVDPKEITVGRIVRMIDGPLEPVRCSGDTDSACCPLLGQCSLSRLWTDAREALEKVYDATDFQKLAEQEKEIQRQNVLDYCI